MLVNRVLRDADARFLHFDSCRPGPVQSHSTAPCRARRELDGVPIIVEDLAHLHLGSPTLWCLTTPARSIDRPHIPLSSAADYCARPPRQKTTSRAGRRAANCTRGVCVCNWPDSMCATFPHVVDHPRDVRPERSNQAPAAGRASGRVSS